MMSKQLSRACPRRSREATCGTRSATSRTAPFSTGFSRICPGKAASASSLSAPAREPRPVGGSIRAIRAQTCDTRRHLCNVRDPLGAHHECSRLIPVLSDATCPDSCPIGPSGRMKHAEGREPPHPGGTLPKPGRLSHSRGRMVHAAGRMAPIPGRLAQIPGRNSHILRGIATGPWG